MTASAGDWWTLGLFALPLVGAASSFLFGRRVLPWLPLLVGLAVLACSAGMLWELGRAGPWSYPVGGWGAPLGIVWRVDGMTGLLLAATAVVSVGVAGYAALELRARPGEVRMLAFWPLMLFLWAALNALFLAGDVFHLYVTLELLTLAAVGLVALAGEPAALLAAMRYLLFALLGSMSYLLGVGLLYGAFGTLDLVLLAQRMQPQPAAALALGLMTAGLFAKTALFPLHGWLPPAHGSAPTVSSALLSGLVVSAGAYLLMRLLLGPFAGLSGGAVGQLLGATGAVAVLWGSLLALRQRRLKRLVAYSTVAQLGYLLLIVPLGPAAIPGGILLACAHALAKAAMFLAAGVVREALGHDRIGRLGGLAVRLPLPFFAMGLAGLTLMGLPPSGGFAAKWLLLVAAVDAGQWWWALVLLGGGLLAAAYVFRVLAPALGRGEAAPCRPTAPGLGWLCLALALASLLLGLWPLPLLRLLAPEGLYLETGG